MDCPDNEILVKYIDGEPNSIPGEVRRHLEECDRCHDEIESIRKLDSTVGKLMTENQFPSSSSEHRPDAMMLAAYMDGKLSLADRESIDHHLASCEVCLDQIVAVAEWADSAAEKPQSTPAYLLERAIALEPSKNPKSSPAKNQRLFDVVLRLVSDAVEIVSTSAEWVIPLPTVEPAVRAKSMTSRGTTVEVQRDIGGYRIEVEVEHVKGGLCDVAVRVKGQDGKAVDGLRLSLFAAGREQASYL